MAVAPGKPRSLFGDVLRREIDAQGLSVKQLARRLANGDEARVESVRRSLMRYIAGSVQPGPEMRDALADELGLDRAVFADHALRIERRDRLARALLPLADVLLELATETKAQA